MWLNYLNRIGLKREEISIDECSLKELHKQHILNIPFEDLDIHSSTPISLNIDSILNKVVEKNRGGFCYELNYLFCSLLKNIGFEAHLISSRIYNENGIIGPEFDHLSIIVTLDDKWLLDVGYGDLFILPLKLKNQYLSKDWFKFYKIDAVNKRKFSLSESKDGKLFTKKYQFTTELRKIADFEQQLQFKQNSADSYFVKNLICTLPNLAGRNTIFNNKFIERKNGIRKEFEIKGEIEMNSLLKNRFNISMENRIKAKCNNKDYEVHNA